MTVHAMCLSIYIKAASAGSERWRGDRADIGTQATAKQISGPRHYICIGGVERIEQAVWAQHGRRNSLIGVGLFGVVKLVARLPRHRRTTAVGAGRGDLRLCALKVISKQKVVALKQTVNV